MTCVLIVEPDNVLARTYASALITARYEAFTARTAQSAIDAADEHAPDCIVLELQLPGHNGIEFLYELRSYAEWQHVPVILNTYTPRSEFVHMYDALTALGIVQVLYKPQATLAKLVRAVREVTAEAHEEKLEQNSNTSVAREAKAR
ncbi:MAG TPA: response regulator [Candidatus Saccharimonadales bacterium]